MSQEDWQGSNSNAIWQRQKGNLSEAIRLMDEAIKAAVNAQVSQPRTAMLYNYLADIHIENNDFGSARRTIEQALSVSQSLQNICHGDNLLMLSDILVNQEDYEGALKAANDAKVVFQRNEHSHGVQRAAEKVNFIEVKSDG